jgi:RNA-directed DNA polymerase
VTKLDFFFPLDDLAERLQLSTKSLYYWSYVVDVESHYAKFSVMKSSGGTRTIAAPHGGLKLVQLRILKFLEEVFRPRQVVHGFVKGKSIVTNAEQHTDRRFVLNVDLKDFFPSINFGRVRGALIANPIALPPSAATVIARITCLNNQLPQGAPTSPLLSNIVCSRLDSELLRLVGALGCTYTRYADDISISTHRRQFPAQLATALNPPYGTSAKLADPLVGVIQSNGFAVNETKIRLFGRHCSQRVTGLIVNETTNVDRRFVRDIRGAIHAWRKHGLAAAEAQYLKLYAKRHRAPYRSAPSFKQHVVGKLRFLSMVRGPANPLFVRLARQCRELDQTLFTHALDGEEQVERSLWVLESENESTQGTAFFVDGIGLVTCYHVVATDTYAYHPSKPSDKFPVTIRKYDAHLDLAILDSSAPSGVSLRLAERDELHRNQRVQLVGYPNFGPGDSLYRAWGYHSMNKVRSGVTYRVSNVTIASGNSGGPLLDEHYKVVGIAARGVKNLLSNPTEPDVYAAIAIQHLRELVSRP